MLLTANIFQQGESSGGEVSEARASALGEDPSASNHLQSTAFGAGFMNSAEERSDNLLTGDVPPLAVIPSREVLNPTLHETPSLPVPITQLLDAPVPSNLQMFHNVSTPSQGMADAEALREGPCVRSPTLQSSPPTHVTEWVGGVQSEGLDNPPSVHPILTYAPPGEVSYNGLIGGGQEMEIPNTDVHASQPSVATFGTIPPSTPSRMYTPIVGPAPPDTPKRTEDHRHGRPLTTTSSEADVSEYLLCNSGGPLYRTDVDYSADGMVGSCLHPVTQSVPQSIDDPISPTVGDSITSVVEDTVTRTVDEHILPVAKDPVAPTTELSNLAPAEDPIIPPADDSIPPAIDDPTISADGPPNLPATGKPDSQAAGETIASTSAMDPQPSRLQVGIPDTVVDTSTAVDISPDEDHRDEDELAVDAMLAIPLDLHTTSNIPHDTLEPDKMSQEEDEESMQISIPEAAVTAVQPALNSI